MRHASQDKVGIYLVAANPSLREALARVLSTEAGFNIVGVCAPGANAEGFALASAATVVLVDDFGAERSDLKLMKKLMTATPSLKVILVGMPETERAFLDSVRAGTIGYVLRDASSEVLISSVRAVVKGEATCPARMISSLYKYVPGGGIACPSFRRSGRDAASTAHITSRALHSFVRTS